MAQFLGKSVRITLADNSQVQGLVSKVDNGELELKDVLYLNSGKRMTGSAKFSGGRIKDLDILTTPASNNGSNNTNEIVDPAVLSAGPQRKQTKQLEEEGSSDESEVDENPYTAQEFLNKNSNTNGNNTISRPSSSNNSSSGKKPQQQQQQQQQKKKKKKPQQQQQQQQQQNGSTTWDVKGIQNSQEFDFQANLNLFDKQTVFNEIRQHDATLPGQRLVEHNKQQPQSPQPKSSQTKYGTREMIIEPRNNSNSSNGNSADHSPNSHHLVFSNSPSNICPVASPMQLLELERLSSEAHGVSEVMVTENVGRGIGQLALKALGGTSRFTANNHNAHPLVVVLIGNNRSGCRALAAARHLANRHVRVLAVLTVERHSLSPLIQSQLLAFESSKGKVLIKRVQTLTAALTGYASPPELVIDGIEGYQQSVEDLWEGADEPTEMAELIRWANKQRCGVMCVDIPSGLDPATGQVSSDRSRPFIQPKWILSSGLPLFGVLNSQLDKDNVSPAAHYLLDSGYPQGAMSSGPLKKFSQIWFGAEWVLELSAK